MKLHMVRAVLQTKFGTRTTIPRIVMASDNIDAARQCFEELPKSAKQPGTKWPLYFKVFPQRSPEDFRENVGVIELRDDDEDQDNSCSAWEDLFASKHVEVRL